MRYFCVKSGMLIIIFSASISLVGLFSSHCKAAEYGLGLSARDSSSAIYIPVNITNNFRTELFFAYSSSEEEGTSSSREYDSVGVGLGLFGLKNIYDKTQMYYGCRFSYSDASSESSFVGSSYDAKYYSIAPTLGLEYFIADNISLAGEFEFYYRDESREYVNPANDRDYTFTGTDTQLVLRYYFK